MPNLLNEQRLNRVEYISMADYVRSMDTLETLEDKMAFTTRYLLSHGGGDNRDVSLEEAIMVAKLKIADASAMYRQKKGIVMADEAIDPNIDDEVDARYRQFLIEPVQYLQDQATSILQRAAQQTEHTPEMLQRLEGYTNTTAALSRDFDGSVSRKIDDIQYDPQKRAALGVKARLEARFGDKRGLDKAYDNTKGSFMSRLFGTSSQAAKNLDQVYQAFQNEDHVLYGDMDSLDKAATQYLQHLFPRWDPEDGLMTQQTIAQLSGTQKSRATLAYGILLATKAERKSEEVHESLVNANLQKRAEQEAGIEEDSAQNNAAFQQEVANDVQEEEFVPDEQAEKDFAANFKDGPSVDNDEVEGPNPV